MTAAYTWSHTLDNAPSAFGSSGGVIVGANGTPLLHFDRGNADTDQRQLFTFSSIYELPFGRGKAFGNDAPSGSELRAWRLAVEQRDSASHRHADRHFWGTERQWPSGL